MERSNFAETSSHAPVKPASELHVNVSEAIQLADRTARSLRVARDAYVDFLAHQSDPSVGLQCLHARLGDLSPRSDGFFRKAFGIEGSAVQMPPELGADDIIQLQRAKDTANSVVDELKIRWTHFCEKPANSPQEQLSGLYGMQAFAECCVGGGPVAMDASRRLMATLVDAGEYAEAGYQVHRFIQRGGSFRPHDPDDKKIANAAVRFFDGVEFIDDEDERLQAMRSAGFCLSGAKAAADENEQQSIEQRLQALRHMLGLMDAADVSVVAGWPAGQASPQQEMARYIEGITGKFAEEYKAKARIRLAEAYGPSATENRDTALQWLERFKRLATSMGAARDVQMDDAERTRHLEAASTTLRRIVGHQAAKERVLTIYETYLRGLSVSGVLAIEGPPGNGKSSLAALCGEVFFGAHAHERCRKQNLAALPWGTSPSGHGGQILDAQPSLFADVMMQAGTGQVVFVLDEIEKAAQLQDQLAAVLEPTDIYRDSYFGLPLDLSEALFICIYNDRDALSAHLQDRLDGAIVTRGLDHEQTRAVAALKLNEAAVKFGCPDISFAPQVIDMMATKAASGQGEEQSGRLIASWSEQLVMAMSSSLENPENVRRVEVEHLLRCIDGRWTEGHQPKRRKNHLWQTTLACKRFSEQLQMDTLVWRFVVGESAWEFRLSKSMMALRLVDGHRQKAKFGCKVTATSNGATEILANLPSQTMTVSLDETIAWSRSEHQQAFAALQQTSSEDTFGHALKCTLSAEVPPWA